MPRIFFKLNISATEIQAYYRGQSQVVVAQSEDGKKLQFPAKELRKFVTHEGVQGRFEISYSQDSKLLGLRRIG